jgi:hypothetical protein
MLTRHFFSAAAAEIWLVVAIGIALSHGDDMSSTLA